MYLKILAHPVFANLNFHMPMIVDLSHPLVMLTGENGCGKSTLLHAIYYALRGDEMDGYVYKLDRQARVMPDKRLLFDAEQHNPRTHLELFDRPAADEGVRPDGEPWPGDAVDVSRDLSELSRRHRAAAR